MAGENEGTEAWEPKTRDDWVDVFADALGKDRGKQAQEAADKAAADAAANTGEGNGNGGGTDDKPAKRARRNFLGGSSS